MEVYDTELGYGEYVVGTDIPGRNFYSNTSVKFRFRPNDRTIPFICMDISLKMHLMRMKILLKWKM